jgi:hypothetical protein
MTEVIRLDGPAAWREIELKRLDLLDPHRPKKWPIYLFDSVEVQDHVDIGDCLGISPTTAAANCEATIRKMGLWAGWSPLTIIVNRAVLTGDNGSDVIMHEYVHLAWRQKILNDLAKVHGDEPLEKIVSEPTNKTIVAPNRLPTKKWEGHEPLPFGRIALHVFSRARKLGFWTRPDNIWLGYNYGLQSAELFLHELGDEPIRLSHLSLCDIAGMESPGGYKRFSDVSLVVAEEIAKQAAEQ